MLFPFRWVLLMSILLPQTAENVGSRIVTRHTISAGIASEQTLYIMADRRRMETRHSTQQRDSGGPTETMDEPSGVFIVRCDLGQSFILYPQRQECTSADFPPKRLTAEEAAGRGLKKPENTDAAKPTLRIETTTVDTGERKEMFGYSARHVIITRKQIPLEGSNSQPQETVTDGWYIDMERSISCDPKPAGGAKVYGFVFSSAGSAGGKQMPIEVPEFVDIGPRETGLSVKVTTASPVIIGYPDGTRRTSPGLDETAVTVLEKAALDPALFEIPDAYKHVERHQ
jgi:hypothetical protein